jgi:hypothetical protein
MGLFDTVRLERSYPEYDVPAGLKCQTKSLYASCHEFTITADGKLVEHLFRYEPDPERVHPMLGHILNRAIPIGDKVIDFHGDISLVYTLDRPHDRLQELVARFTHGQLEWIRPIEQYPAGNRTLLTGYAAQ